MKVLKYAISQEPPSQAWKDWHSACPCVASYYHAVSALAYIVVAVGKAVGGTGEKSG